MWKSDDLSVLKGDKADLAEIVKALYDKQKHFKWASLLICQTVIVAELRSYE